MRINITLLLFTISFSFFGNIHAQYPITSDYIFNEKYENVSAKNDAVYILRIEQQDDTTFINRFYNVMGPMIYQETYKDAKNDTGHGVFCWYNSLGDIDSSGYIFNNQREGIWKYYVNAKVVKHVEFLHDVMQNEKFINDTLSENNPDGSPDFHPAKFKPTFGYISWDAYIYSNIHNTIAQDNNINKYIRGPYTCIVCFLVSKEGEIINRNTYLTTSEHILIDEDVLKMIRKSTSWIPATKNGIAVDFTSKLHLTYMTDEDY